MAVPQRSTRQRAAVADALARAERFQSALELHHALHHRGEPVGLATVYRHLQALVEAGAVDVLRGDDGEARYRACPTTEHHHHLVCRRCDRSVEVVGPAVERWAAAVAGEHGFTQVSHTLEVFGVCAACTEAGGG